MDKETLSNYGWIVICVLVLSVMIALATPFGSFVSNAVQNTTEGLFKTEQNAMEEGLKAAGVELEDVEFDNVATVCGNNNTTNTLPAKGKTLEEYTWAEVQQIVQAGKATEYGFNVGSTKTLQINGATKTATIIGLNHDKENSITFLINSWDGIGYKAMNVSGGNTTSWKHSEMCTWLNNDVYNTMTDTKDYIVEVSKQTDIGFQAQGTLESQDKVFLLSLKEANLAHFMEGSGYVNEATLNYEGTTYEYFTSGSFGSDTWLRTPYGDSDNSFFACVAAGPATNPASIEMPVCPAFVIG